MKIPFVDGKKFHLLGGAYCHHGVNKNGWRSKHPADPLLEIGLISLERPLIEHDIGSEHPKEFLVGRLLVIPGKVIFEDFPVVYLDGVLFQQILSFGKFSGNTAGSQYQQGQKENT